MPGQRLIMNGSHVSLAYRAVTFRKSKHMIVQIPNAIARLTPYHVQEYCDAVLSRLFMDGVYVQLQPYETKML